MLNASYSVPHEHVFVEIMRSLFYTWACFMVSQFMYRVLVTILTQQGPRYLFANECRLCVVGEPFRMLDMALWAVHYVIVTAILLNVELVHDWTMSWDECWLIYGCVIAWGDPVIDHESCFIRLVEWLLPISLCDVARMQCSVCCSPMISLQRECTE